MTRRASVHHKKYAAERAAEELEAMAVQETYVLEALQRSGTMRLQDVPNLGPGMLDVVDRLVANQLVTRYPGAIFGVSPQGERRLSGDSAP